MSWTIWMVTAVVIATIYALIKRYETRLVLLTAGFLMALLSMKPMMVFQQFDKSMTAAALIIAICSAIGFASVISITKCDLHLVSLLTKPLKQFGIFLLPACCAVTGLVSIAIPSTAGCCAAVGPTLIPLMIRAGFKPAVAAAAVVGSVTPALVNPGISHNVFVAKLASMEVMQFLGIFSKYTLGLSAFGIVLLTVICFFYKDYKKNVGEADLSRQENSTNANLPELPEHPNVVYALAPLVPVVLLIIFSLWVPSIKMSVATAMLIGAVYAMVVTRTSPEKVTKEFFNGMGKGYANILGIIIAAGVFAAGLRAAGVVDAFVAFLTQTQGAAKIGGAVGPYLLGILTGSGDAAAFAFNEAVTPHAAKFGMTIENLGYLAAIGGGLGRLSSPLCGGLILVAGIAGVSPMEVVKRTGPVMFGMLVAALLIL